MLPRVVLIHWKPEEAVDALRDLRAAGYDAECVAPKNNPELRQLREPPPAALVVDLSRLPSHGRAVAAQWRQWKGTRNIPLVFSGGAPEKVAALQSVFPDAAFCDGISLGASVHAAIRNAPDEPITFRGISGYSGAPLSTKLGIKTDVTLLHAPQGFRLKLEPLPRGVTVHARPARAHRVLLFVSGANELEAQFAKAANSVGAGGGLWIVYPKQASGIETDLTQARVRAFALAAGWVDYKVCAVDDTWTGLLFARRAITSK